jgi:hypothetical protein
VKNRVTRRRVLIAVAWVVFILAGLAASRFGLNHAAGEWIRHVLTHASPNPDGQQ